VLIVPTGVCVPFSLSQGNSSIFTKTGSTANVQGYTDKACKIAGATGSVPLNTCSQVGEAIIVYAYPANTIPPSPFTSTTGQVIETSA